MTTAADRIVTFINSHPIGAGTAVTGVGVATAALGVTVILHRSLPLNIQNVIADPAVQMIVEGLWLILVRAANSVEVVYVFKPDAPVKSASVVSPEVVNKTHEFLERYGVSADGDISKGQLTTTPYERQLTEQEKKAISAAEKFLTQSSDIGTRSSGIFEGWTFEKVLKKYPIRQSAADLATDWRRQQAPTFNGKSILLIHTGGTFGQVPACDPRSRFSCANDNVPSRNHDQPCKICPLEPAAAGKMRERLSLFPYFAGKLVTHPQKGHIVLLELEPLIDSTEAMWNEWNLLSILIDSRMKEYDGFVIIHGTDTLAYTASALSFMLQEQSKLVVVTGSQTPAFRDHSDAIDNLIGAIELAKHYIPKVLVYMHNKAMNGNRIVKKFTPPTTMRFIRPTSASSDITMVNGISIER